jgi:hypothetical protein
VFPESIIPWGSGSERGGVGVSVGERGEPVSGGSGGSGRVGKSVGSG